MKFRRRLSVFLILGVLTLIPTITIATDSRDWTYQIQSASFADRTEFYFFRFEKETGSVQVLKYDGEARSGKPVSWHDLRDKANGGAFTYIINKE